MFSAECKTDFKNSLVISFAHTQVLNEAIRKLASSNIVYIESTDLLTNKQINFTSAEAFFFENSTTENSNIDIIKKIRSINKTACIFILTTYSKSFSSINYYIAGADYCIKLPGEPQEMEKILSRALENSHWKSPSPLFLDRTRLLICSATCRLEISYTEMTILEALINAPEHILNQDSIAKTLDPNVVFYDPRALEKTISRLRVKIKKIYGLELIISVRTYGYRLRRGTIRSQ